ncbi:hypothetical protein DL764_004992 [Monosporascus ibericus]|uniref:Inhibitor of growth protein N-terminal histone-binding domain-containing protein n=1 Tax=Monosporascus ibericus TaxID=155417 RepID=A0A4Q4TAN4_9PEZI|nr:hypothetical protein DL764_004992 [Monosporascus ibericus]
MKTAKPPQADAGPSSSRRAQPVRQTRTNPPRTNSGLSRTLSGRELVGGNQGHEQPIDIFPAVTHFTDAITALPKDLVRHFTLLKEVDAKIFAPEETLFQLVDAALSSNNPESRHANDTSSSVAPVSTPTSAQNSASGAAVNGGHPLGSSSDENYHAAVFDPSNIPRRHLFRQTAWKIQEMLVSLEEKNHVITTANDALSKQLGRINDVWPHLEAEFSEEARWGSTTHWAYPENRIYRANQAERSRRDGAATITAAAQQLAEEAAARSDARKQAVLAKKGLKAQHHDSDADDHDNKQKAETAKRAQGSNSKSRKGAEAAAPVGLGITGGAPVNGNPPSKRRKIESNKAPNGGQPMERAMSSVFGGNNATKAKTSSPRATPAPASEPAKKRKALPTSTSASKKSKTAAAALSPNIASSPVPPSLAVPKNIGHNSLIPPAAAARPSSARARGNSIHSTAEQARQRPTSSASNRQSGTTTGPPDLAVTQNGTKPADNKPKESAPPIKTDPVREEAAPPIPRASSAGGSSKKESTAKAEDAEPPRGETPKAPAPIATSVVTTKSGRASKPSTPALGTFPEVGPRSRNSRTTSTTAKRSHKKGASQQAVLAAQAADEDTNSVQDDDDGEIDADEQRYCYCNGVSYGAMIACDSTTCTIEWFHLDCVGLKDAPEENGKSDIPQWDGDIIGDEARLT